MTVTEAEANAGHAPGTATPKLNKALSQLQGELPQIKKTKTAKIKYQDKAGVWNSHEYSYADLGDVVADVGPLLAKHGLAFHCAPTINPVDRREMLLLWSLLHESGEEKSGEWPLGPVNQKPQSLGSAITYGRRYCFTAATNIVLEDDDDGQRAQQDHGSGQSAGDAWENATPAKPRQDNGHAPPPASDKDAAAAEASDRRWADLAIEQAASLKSEAEGTKLYKEAAARHRAGECTRDEADHIQSLVTARIADRRKEAATRILKPVADDDPWRDTILDLADDEAARERLTELQDTSATGQMDIDRARLLGRAIIAMRPRAAVKDPEAAA